MMVTSTYCHWYRSISCIEWTDAAVVDDEVDDLSNDVIKFLVAMIFIGGNRVVVSW